MTKSEFSLSSCGQLVPLRGRDPPRFLDHALQGGIKTIWDVLTELGQDSLKMRTEEKSIYLFNFYLPAITSTLNWAPTGTGCPSHEMGVTGIYFAGSGQNMGCSLLHHLTFSQATPLGCDRAAGAMGRSLSPEREWNTSGETSLVWLWALWTAGTAWTERMKDFLRQHIINLWTLLPQEWMC